MEFNEMDRDYKIKEIDDDNMSPMQKQMWHDVEVEMAKVGLSWDNFPEGVDPGSFVDVTRYKE